MDTLIYIAIYVPTFLYAKRTKKPQNRHFLLFTHIFKKRVNQETAYTQLRDFSQKDLLFIYEFLISCYTKSIKTR